MNITKATRWRVFAGVWLQSLFTVQKVSYIPLHP